MKEDVMDKGTRHGRFRSAATLAAALLAACSGNTGSTTLVSTQTEPAGTNCAAGGVKIQVGVDTNGNGVLDSGEVNAQETRFVCNGASGNSLVKTSPEPAGANCPSGGLRVDTGVDA